MKVKLAEGTLDEMELIEAIEKIKYGGTTSVTTKEGKKVVIKVERIPQEAVVWE
ncbi:MAG: hypothetical protein QXW65_02160 [Candidatus Pacearchaeota archaeon]